METTMKRLYALLAFVCLAVAGMLAQEHYTEGPIWRIQLIRVKPTQMDAYLSSLRQSTKPFLEEEKKQGLVTDYKVFLKETNNGRKTGTSASPCNSGTGPRWMAQLPRPKRCATRSWVVKHRHSR